MVEAANAVLDGKQPIFEVVPYQKNNYVGLTLKDSQGVLKAIA